MDHTVGIWDRCLHSRRDPERRPTHGKRQDKPPTKAEATKSSHELLPLPALA
jgi:hypothetical protein